MLRADQVDASDRVASRASDAPESKFYCEPLMHLIRLYCTRVRHFSGLYCGPGRALAPEAPE